MRIKLSDMEKSILSVGSEYEIKILEVKRQDVIRLLKAHDARCLLDGCRVRSTFFTNPSSQQNTVLRLRTYEDRCTTLTLKRERSITQAGIKFSLEDLVLLRTEDYGTFSRLLESLGFNVKRRSLIHRTCYVIGTDPEIKFTLDKYPKIPLFLEIESNCNAGVFRGLNLLGYTLDHSSVKPWTVKQVFQHYASLKTR